MEAFFTFTKCTSSKRKDVYFFLYFAKLTVYFGNLTILICFRLITPVLNNNVFFLSYRILEYNIFPIIIISFGHPSVVRFLITTFIAFRQLLSISNIRLKLSRFLLLCSNLAEPWNVACDIFNEINPLNVDMFQILSPPSKSRQHGDWNKPHITRHRH